MTDHGLFADAEDAGGLASSLAAGGPEHAFALPLGQRRPRSIGACPDELPRRGERHGADDLGGVEHLARDPDRKSVVAGKSVYVSVDLGGPRTIQKKKPIYNN